MIGKNSLKKYKNPKKEILLFSCLLLIALIFCLFYSNFIYKNVSGDAVSIFYPAKMLIEKNNLNMWDKLNDKYDTYYFKLPFTDEVIKNQGESYPAQTPWTIFITSFVMSNWGYDSFFYLNLILSGIIVIFVGLISYKLFKNYLGAIFASMITMTFPVFVFWSVVPQNIIMGIFFFMVSAYCLLLNMPKRGIQLILAGLFFGFSIAVKPFFGVLIIPMIVYIFITSNFFTKDKLKDLSLFVAPLLLIVISLLLFNLAYFGDSLFVGYLHGDYHPISPTISFHDKQEVSTKFFSFIYDPIKIYYSFEYLFYGWFKYSAVFLFSVLISILLLFITKKQKEFTVFAITSFLILSVYIYSIKDLLWAPAITEYAYSLSLTFFRYILIIFLIFGIATSLFWQKAFSFFDKRIIISLVIFLLSTLLIFNLYSPIKYEGGASLNWLSEISPKIINYSDNFKAITKEDSVILYPQRHELSFAYPNIEKYHWFYYDGIPPEYRLSETKRIVSELLSDNRTVFMGLYGEPYKVTLLNKKPGDPNIDDIASYLEKDFEFVYVNNSDCDRLKFSLYEIKEK